ncbi:MAG: serine--tRNA ligase, partial [Methyloprofundus sp.]|nr:serine--tRNA ligase [Methyloprofundus sp.]
MLDPHLFRSDLEFVQAQLKRRAIDFDADFYTDLENRRKAVQVKTQELQNERNSRSKSIGQAKAKGEDVQPLLDQVQGLGEQLKAAEAELADIQLQMKSLMEGLPNILDASVPAGNDEDDNVEISRWGELPEFSFEVKDHVDLGALHKGMDFEVAAKITSARFVALKGDIARLQRAIIQFMLDTHGDEHGYTETYVPYIVNADSLYGTGQLPKFSDDLFKVSTDPDLYLIPTAEVPVTNIVRNEIVDNAEMPVKMVCHT